MTLYHTSPTVVSRPDVLHSRANLDFGKGFYLTTLREQAVKYADKFKRLGLDAWLNVYELDISRGDWDVLTLEGYDEAWLNFVIHCRKYGATDSHDMVVGGIANDKVFETVDLYFAGRTTKEQTLDRLRFEKPNIQYCIRTQRMLDESLTFTTSIQL